MRLLGEETEQGLYELEVARGWKRSGLVSAEQLAAIENDFAPPAQAGWAVRLLLFGFAYAARGALNSFMIWSFFGREALWKGTRSPGLATYFLLSAIPLYLLGEWLAKRHRLYRFGVEEGILLGVFVQLCYGTGLLFNFSMSLKSDFLITGIVATAYLAWLYLRLGYLYALFGAAAALCATIFSQCTSWSENGIRALAAGLFAGLLAASALRREVSDHDRQGWQALQAALLLMICLVLNVRLEQLVDLAHVRPRGGGFFYWASFAAVVFVPALALGWSVARRHRPMLAASFIAILTAVVSVKPYLGLARHSWDPLILGIALMGLSLYLKRLLDSGPEGQRGGFTAKPLIVGRDDGPDFTSLLAAAVAASPAAAAVPKERGFSGQGGSSGGAGAGGTF